MKTRVLVVVALLLGGLWALGALPAQAGGGSCFAPSTSQTDVRVNVSEVCFHPTVVYVKPGATVTWTNRDPMEHTVTGLGLRWGTAEPLRDGQSVSATFGKAGVYPYSCVLHYGMVGAVVVGSPSASQSTGTEGPGLAQPTSEAVATPVAAPVKIKTVVREAGLGPVGITGWVLFGLAGSVLLVMVLRRRRTEPGT
jgi:plastocyanin